MPPFPAPIGSRIVRSNRPSGSDQTLTVLSSDAVASFVQAPSTPTRLIVAVCTPVSIRNTGRWSGQAFTASSSAAPFAPSIASW